MRPFPPLFLAMLVGCSAAAPDRREPPLPLGFEHETTDGIVALANLAAQAEADEGAMLRRADVVAFREAFVASLLARITYAGSFRDLARVDAATAGAQTAEAHRLRARYLSTIHDFAAARAELERARAVDGRNLAPELSTYAIAEGGDLGDALVLRARAAAERPSFATLYDLGVVQAAIGNFDAADAAFVNALEAYGDVSPMPVATVQFQRGVMWAEMAGRPGRARPLYEEAVRRVPGYVSANVHLAELERANGEPDRAVARLRPFVGVTDDPEPAGRLAEWLRAGDPTTAAALATRARETYDALLARWPLAFLDHASEFLVAAGQDPRRGSELADLNLQRRRTSRAYLIALGAAEAAGRRTRACAIAAETPAAALAANVPLRKAVTDMRRRCR